MEGQIIKIISNLYTVKVKDKIYECRARGKFRNEKITPLVGDKCIIDEKDNYILEILPRTNYLTRPTIANVDVAVIVTSVKKPDLSLNLLDKLISNVTMANINPVICLTKLDLLEENEKEEINDLCKYYNGIGIPTTTNENIDELLKILSNKIVVFTGQTGAGKSSLLNKIDVNLNLKTGEISEVLGRGKHTTRHTELFEIHDFYVADTPGFSSIDFIDRSKEEIKNSFVEFSDYTCRFNDCMHNKENNCAVKDAVDNNEIRHSRYDNYISFINNMR